MGLSMRSTAFAGGAEIPREHTGEGGDVSPELSWDGVPPGTGEFALICDDPDAPTPEPWVHWVLYGIGAAVRVLPGSLPARPLLTGPVTATQGKNTWGKIGYNGPLPPPGHGWHRYMFTLYALKKALSLPPGMTKNELLQALNGNILETAILVGKYRR